ncbi:MAG: class I SAM-dependent methyltransferase [Bdellovibrionales bacterium]|nr:class I SAM-dependent methyltransferase [Bdellovibrionales bacterium]
MDITEHDYNKSWDKWGDMIRYSPAPRHRRRIALRLMRAYSPPSGAMHDIGCGNGLFLNQVRQVFPALKLHGSDISDNVIQQNADHFPDMEFSTLDLCVEHEVLPQYDIITCMEVLEHVPNLHLAMNNISAMLRPGGILILSVPSGPVRPIDKMMGHVQHFRNASPFCCADLKIRKQYRWGFPFFNLYKWAINLRPEAMNAAFAETQYSSWQKLVGSFVFVLFYFNANFGGEQLFAVLQKDKSAVR